MDIASQKILINKKAVFIAALGLVLAVIGFWDGLSNLVDRWIQREEYSHGFFIPILSLFFLWHRREALLKSFGQPSWVSLVVVLIAGLLLIIGELSAIFILTQIGFVLVLFGLVLALGGWSLSKVAFLPIAFLVFAIPMPYFIDAQLTWGLQLISSQIGTELLRLFGVYVYLEGNLIDLGNYQLQVVEACSGLNYLYPLLSLGFLAAYLFSAPFWQRAIIFLSTIPITVFMNSFRIAVIGVLVDNWGIEMAEGFLHFFEGWVIFMGCAVLLVLEIWLFDRLGKKRPVGDLLVVPEVKPAVVKKPYQGGFATVLVSVAVIALTATAIITIGDRQEEVVERKNLNAFPLQIGEWSAREDHLPSIVEQKLAVDDYLLADYRLSAKESINFYVAYYNSQRKGVSPHSPRVCIPGGGWLITDLQEVMVEHETLGTFPVNRITIEKGDFRQLGYYWFEQRGRRIANEYWMKWYLLIDAIVMNRTDGALVRVMTDFHRDEDLETAENRLKHFVTAAMNQLPEYVPGE